VLRLVLAMCAFALVSPGGARRNVVVNEGLAVAYDFQEGKGTTLADGSGNRQTGKIFGAEWATLGKGYALRFDGVDDYVACGSSVDLNFDGEHTIEAWVYPEEVPTGEVVLVGMGDGSWLLTYGPTARFWWYDGRAQRKCRARAPAGLWHHVVATTKGSTRRIYIDGGVAGGVRQWTQNIKLSGSGLFLGGGISGFGHFKGLLHGVRVYWRALTAQEVFQRFMKGRPTHRAARSPKRQAFGKDAKVLNNLVAELLNLTAPLARHQTEYTFTNPREGWVFITVTANLKDTETIRLSLDGEHGERPVIVLDKPGLHTQEAMRYLSAGQHSITLQREGEPEVRRLIVRAIPELIYARFPSTPSVSEYGPYDWRFLERTVIPNVNTIVGPVTEESLPYIRTWKKQGKRWLSEHTAPWTNPTSNAPIESAEEAYRLLAEKQGLQHALLDGVVLDTFDVGHDDRYMYFIKAVRRVHQNEAFRNKLLYSYCDTLYGAEKSRAFARTVLESGYHLVWTRYMHEQPTTLVARVFLEHSLAEEALGWEKYVPGSLQRMVMALGYLSAPPETMNIRPDVNYLVYMDMQCNLLANHPAFSGLYGVMWYTASYADEEAVRWAGKVFRHYFIEGKRDMFSADPYRLNHLRNPDFDEGSRGWELSPAEAGSIAPGHLERNGFLQGRWLETAVGDNFLWTRRSAERPNRFSQVIRNLQPGRLYSLKMYTADYRDVIERNSNPQKLTVSIAIDNAELLPEKCLQHVFSNLYYYHLGPTDDTEAASKTWMNYHRLVFRAKRTTARLTVSDWAGPNEPGGPIGQEQIYNFIEVQPYLPDSSTGGN
jgi:hypothetical protein